MSQLLFAIVIASVFCSVFINVRMSFQHTSIHGSYLKVMVHCIGLCIVIPLGRNSGCCLAMECKLMVYATSSQSDCRYVPTFPFPPSSKLEMQDHQDQVAFHGFVFVKEDWRTAELSFAFLCLEKIILFLCCIINLFFHKFSPSPLFTPY